MSSYPPLSQINFVIQWFKSWSEFQKEDFVSVFAQRLTEQKEGSGDNIENLANGIKGLDTTGRPPSLFSCQVKLFNEWWTTWSSEDREKMSSLFLEADPAFYTSVEMEMSGNRRKLDEDFMTVVESTQSENHADEDKENEGENNSKSPPPVFNVTKVVINNGPSSMSSSVDLEEKGNGETNDDEQTNGVNSIEQDLTVTAESPTQPEATEI